MNSGNCSFLCLDSSSLAGGGGGDSCSFVGALQDAITSNQLAVHILMMVTIHLMSLSMSLSLLMWQEVPLLYSYGFQNTWVISMGFLFFFTGFGVLEGPSLFGTNLL